MRALLATVALALAAAPASADQLTEPVMVPSTASIADQIADRVTLLGDEIGLHLSTVSGGYVDLSFDGRRRKARFHLGSAADLGFQLNADVQVRGKTAHVHAVLRLRLEGHDYRFELPEVQVVPQNMRGEQYIELRLPILSGRF